MVNFNGDLLPQSAHFLNHRNRGLRYGDALFESIKYSGSQLLFWEDHYFRLMASMRQLRMEIPMDFTMEYLEAEIRKTLEASALLKGPARIRLTVFRKDGGLYLPETLEVDFVIESHPWPDASYVLPSGEYRADIFRDYHLLADGLARLKHGNRLVQVLGSIYARENNLQTCLVLNHRKEVAEALNGNLFIRKGDRIKTPPLESGCLAGIMRLQLLRLAGTDTRYQWEEGAISPFELQQADELFTTNALMGVQPISDYRKASFGAEAARYVLERLNASLEAQA